MKRKKTVGFSINLSEPRWLAALPEYEKLIRAALKILSDNVDGFAGEISILFCDDVKIQGLNREFRGKDKPTNVLSFPQGDEDDLLGDIAMSLDTLEREAMESGKNLADHFTHLFMHGALHLAEYDHDTDDDQVEMEELEIRLLAKLGVEDPY